MARNADMQLKSQVIPSQLQINCMSLPDGQNIVVMPTFGKQLRRIGIPHTRDRPHNCQPVTQKPQSHPQSAIESAEDLGPSALPPCIPLPARINHAGLSADTFREGAKSLLDPVGPLPGGDVEPSRQVQPAFVLQKTEPGRKRTALGTRTSSGVHMDVQNAERCTEAL